MKLYEKTIFELREIIDKKQASCEEITASFIERITKEDFKINGYITNTFEKALETAKVIDDKISKNEDIGSLGGIPYALKDNICTLDIKTTCASKFLENFVSPYSAYVYKKLEQANCVLLGKANMDEFAMGSSNENSAFGKVSNPWDLTRVPGGSSGASAALVAGGEAAFTLGSDTGGSIRTPASYCGVTGIKPTYGRVSRYGLVAFASSLDQIGPLTKDVKDASLVLNAICGYDENDSTSIKREKEDFTSYLKEDLTGLKVGYDEGMFNKGCDGDVKEKVMEAMKVLESKGATLVPVSFDLLDYAIPVYYIISSSEASSNLSRFDGIRYGKRAEGKDVEEIIIASRSEGFGDEVKRRIMLGTYALSAGYYDMFYNKALKVRRLIKEDYDNVFNKCDIFLSPTTPTSAFKIGEKSEDPLTMYLSDIYTVTANLAGIPSMSIPCGFDKNNMPIGLQLSANVFNEKALIKAGYSYQQSTTFTKERAEF